MFSAALYARVQPFCTISHTRPRVQRASGIPCSLLFEGQRNAKLGQIVPRERGRVSELLKIESHLSQRHCERSEAIHLTTQRKNGLLRCARNDVDGPNR